MGLATVKSYERWVIEMAKKMYLKSRSQLEEAMKARGFSQSRAAMAVGVGQSAISLSLNRGWFALPVARCLADELDLEFDEFFSDKQPAPTYTVEGLFRELEEIKKTLSLVLDWVVDVDGNKV